MAQGRTDIDGFFSPDELEPHPINDDIYDDRTEPDKALEASIEKHGILNPIIVDPQPDAGEADDKPTIISGHRRVEVAKKLNLDEVPVEELRLASELERRELLLEFNRNRDKTFSQRMREARELERIERERAQERQGTRTDIVENSPSSADSSTDKEYGKTRDKVADETGFGSGRTFDKAKTVWKAAQDGDTVAQHEVAKLDRDKQSIHGAYEQVKDRLEPSSEADEEANDTEEADTSSETAEDDSKQLSPEDVILSAHVGENAKVFPKVLDLHVESGSHIADVTYGNGSFWRRVPSDKYELTATDIDPARSPDSTDGVDCRDLPYDDESFDCVVLDPPYKGGFYESEDKPSENKFWMTDRYVGSLGEQSATYHEAVINMYAAAGKEAHRVLEEDGVLVVKTQDEVSENEQRFTHIQITEIFSEMGFHAKDLFVVVRPDRPTIGRTYEQRRARKNHSFFLVFGKRE